VYHNLQKILKKKFGGDSTLIGDEGGFAPPCDCRSGLPMHLPNMATFLIWQLTIMPCTAHVPTFGVWSASAYI